jgi:hypothetical protein
MAYQRLPEAAPSAEAATFRRLVLSPLGLARRLWGALNLKLILDPRSQLVTEAESARLKNGTGGIRGLRAVDSVLFNLFRDSLNEYDDSMSEFPGDAGDFCDELVKRKVPRVFVRAALLNVRSLVRLGLYSFQ